MKAAGRSGLGVAAGFVFPNLFLNRTRAASGKNPSEFIRVGFIGTGGQGMANLKALLPHATAVCDVDKHHLVSAVKLVATETGRQPKQFGDYRKMLEDKSIDAVLIATPDHWHALPAIEACEAGKDVYCEKPLTLTIAEGQKIVKAAARTKRILQTGSQQRSEGKFLQAAEYIRNGRLGKIKRVLVGLSGVNWTTDPPVRDSKPPRELDYDFWLGPAPWRPYNKQHVHYYFRFFWDYSGGQMTNWGAHHLDIVQWALGMDASGPVEIEGRGEFDPAKRFEVPVKFAVTYKYTNAVTVECRSPLIQVAELLPDKREQAREILNGKDEFHGTIFEGEKGLLYVNRGVVRVWPEEIFDEPIKSTDTRLYASTDHHRNWLDCIKTRQAPICDAQVGHRSATVCHLGNISLRTGRKIHWNPATEEIVGDAEAAKWVDKAYRKPWKLPED